ncbi:MAG: hypothetical protein AB7E49_09335 [Campylobacterales bacterium]
MEFVIVLAFAAIVAAAALTYALVFLFSKIKNLFASRQVKKSSLNYPVFRK